MQAENSVHAYRKRRRRILAVLSVLGRRAPTRLAAQHYHHIQAQLDDVHFKSTFGLTISEFEAIHHALRLPDPVRTSVNDVSDSKTALLMLLAWLRGSRLRSLEGQFGWSHSRSSRIIHQVSEFIHRRWCHLLDVTSARHRLLSPRRLDYYAAAIERKTRLPQFWGAIDGTVRPIAMPINEQREAYNGHKRVHALKYQFIATPDGLLFVSAPFDGRRHDAHMVIETHLVAWAAENAKGEDGEQRYLYGDQAYGVSPAIISPFKGNLITRNQELTNHVLGKYRTTVEWGIGMVSMQWPRFRDKQYQRTGLTPCGRDWMVATLLWNAKTCLIGNQISISMGCNPPTLEEYFSSPRVVVSTALTNPAENSSGINSPEHADNNDEVTVNEVL
ncbi:uncharacterized protein UTRI_05218 [Ustilago trichophora]|uniref:DDE Tnp4 domain-containing protein n=1 Tax=Ustilago trichophora TaxID=86804 RepID=A0A5C3EM80_9BASI|nr:uncharacterized protein UTRI_06409 [Ustilago trichophora]SPO30601.1 uncharacterized protein UTRI_05218 [Ustilago trichophora]